MDTTCLIPGTCLEGTGCDCEVVFLSLHYIKYSFFEYRSVAISATAMVSTVYV